MENGTLISWYNDFLKIFTNRLMKILKSDEFKESKLNMNIDDLLSSIIEGCKYILSKGNIRFNLFTL